jgi:hypothetical protein
MRGVLGFALVAGLVAGGEEPPEPSRFSALGFPVTFNDEIITENDVARFLELPLKQIDDNTLKAQRNMLIYRKLAERIAADLGLDVEDREVDEQIRRQVDLHGGDAKFYEWLAQQGTSLERYRLELRQNIIEFKLKVIFTTGFSHDYRQMLPWRVGPTPRELEAAFRNDAGRREGSARVRRLFLEVNVDPEERKKIVVQQALGASEEEVKALFEGAVRPKLEAVLAALETRPFRDVAREHGVDVDALEKAWVPVTGPTEIDRFLAEAEPGTSSPPILQPGGSYVIMHLLERDRPGDRKSTDPAVAEEYSRRIRTLRATKWEALMRRKALDGSAVDPPRVRDEVRDLILTSLREAEDGLRALGVR